MLSCFLLPLLMLNPVQQDTKSRVPLHQQLGIKLTGKNGYEEYLAAADFVAKNKDPELLAMFGSARSSDSFLKTARKITHEFQPAVVLIQKGNEKEVWDPRDSIGYLTVFPELASFRSVGRVLVATAYTRLADGQHALAADAVIALADFAFKSSGTTVVSYLVSSSMMGLIYPYIGNRWSSFSLSQLSRMERVFENLSKKPSGLKRALEGEIRSDDQFMIEIQKDPADLEGLLTDQDDIDPALKDQFEQASLAEKKSLVLAVFHQKKQRLQRVISVLGQPESNWIDPNLPVNESSLEGALLAMFEFSADIVLARGAQNTTSLRLLHLHLQIAQFHWEHRKIPESLAMLPSQDGTFDPLANAPFQYEPRADGTYRLYSKGNKITGEIELGIRTLLRESMPDSLPPYSSLAKKQQFFKQMYGTNAR